MTKGHGSKKHSHGPLFHIVCYIKQPIYPHFVAILYNKRHNTAPFSQRIQRTLRPVSDLAYNVRIDHRCFHILVAEQLLHLANVRPRH